MAEIDRLNATGPGIRVLKGIEVDVLADGSLDLDTALLAQLDIVIASVHSHFRQDEKSMTDRIVRALESGVVDVLGHPTGRLIGHREPYAVDVERVIAAAAATGTALEINANWMRRPGVTVSVAAPKLGASSHRTGIPKFSRSMRLKNSARKTSCWSSVKMKCFINARLSSR